MSERWLDSANVFLLGALERLDSHRDDTSPWVEAPELHGERWEYEVHWKYADVDAAMAAHGTLSNCEGQRPPVSPLIEQPWQQMWTSFLSACEQEGQSVPPFLERTVTRRGRDGFFTIYYAYFPTKE
ncbi:MAG TPA: hypothetical protein VKI44_11560 [Acetobacteraceae bacterium]|nr:hypothetical protein [Acetobacteraceae bacterium]